MKAFLANVSKWSWGHSDFDWCCDDDKAPSYLLYMVRPCTPCTANCIIFDHLSVFEPGLVAPFLTLPHKKRLAMGQNGPKFEPRRVSKPFM
jgi:hypothetical protein